ncbi:MAG: HAMP domain-containing protein [Saprospiraceae bacterium]|nr:HAMP domain-containing protein [Pyrinomonadaceae bacterium]
MENDQIKKQRRKTPWILGALVLVLLTLLILLQTSNLWKNFSVDSASDTLLLYALSSLNFIAFVIFGFIFLRSIIKLIRERRAFQLGARIKTRLFLYFAAISLLPIIAMAGFSYLFMNRALERWFSQIPENVVRDARKVEGQTLVSQSKKLYETARMIAVVIDEKKITKADLESISDAGSLTLVEVLSKDYKTIVSAEKPLTAEQKLELDRTVSGLRSGSTSETSLQDGKGFDAAIADFSDGRKLLIVPDLTREESVSQMVDSSLVEFDRLKDQQIIVRQVGFLTLGVLTFLLIFASTWTAFYVARGLTVPIKALAEAADEIAQGNLAHRVNVLAEDELALLVSTFNQMSARLEENSAELSKRQKYIETVLQSLPTGVISFDSDNRVSTINKAAINILRLESANFAEFHLDQLVNEENRNVMERLISRAKRIGHASEQTVLQPENADGSQETEASMPVALTATALADQNGAVLVIEDLSELIAAQRASAWQEVARRMAHEIKNPLTPIQLSAERIAKRFGDPASEPGAVATGFLDNRSSINGNVDLSTAAVIRDGTSTILREVNSLKSMVDEFSRFARLPDAQLESGSVNEIIGQVLTLYEDRGDGARIEPDLAESLPNAMIDAEQLKRVIVNLIENAFEAFDKHQDEKIVNVRTRSEPARDLIVVEIADNGGGIPPSDFQKLFQPYFSTKGRGTGLGLAIVNRIVTEHHSKIKVVSNQPKGSKFIIEIPVIT